MGVFGLAFHFFLNSVQHAVQVCKGVKLLLANNEVHLEKYVQLLRLAPLFITPTTNAFGCHFQLLPIINKV